MASDRVPGLLEMEVSKARSTAAANRLAQLIREIARDNPTWGQERIADEPKLKLGIRFHQGLSAST